MPEAGRMKLAVLDGQGVPLIAWDSAQVAREVIARAMVERIETQVTGRFPFRRIRQTVVTPSLEEAVNGALVQLCKEGGRA